MSPESNVFLERSNVFVYRYNISFTNQGCISDGSVKYIQMFVNYKGNVLFQAFNLYFFVHTETPLSDHEGDIFEKLKPVLKPNSNQISCFYFQLRKRTNAVLGHLQKVVRVTFRGIAS